MMPRTALWIPAAALVAAALLWPGLGAAQHDSFVAAMDRGVTLRQEGRHAEALAAFEAALAIERRPVVLAQIALAELALERWLPGHEHLLEALDASDDAWITHNRAMLTESLRGARRHLGQLVVRVDPTSAEVRVAGRPVGSGSVELWQLPGQVLIEARAPGHVSITREARVRAGGTADVELHLRARDAEAPETPVDVVGDAEMPRSEQEAVVAPTPPADDGPAATHRLRRWLLSLAGVGLVGGVVGHLRYRSHVLHWNGPGCETGELRSDVCASERSGYRRAAAGTAIGYASAFGFTLAALLTGRSVEHDSLTLRCDIGLGGGGCTWRF